MSKNSNELQRKLDAKRAGKRTRNWTVILYPEDLPENWKDLIDDLHFKWIESPIHDMDLNADKTPKKPHYHLLFMFGVVKTIEQVIEMLKGVFGESDNDSIIGVAKPQQVTDRCAIVRYMAHMDNPDKTQYDINKIIGHNGADVSEVLRYSGAEFREMIIAMEEYIEANNITELHTFSKVIRYDYPEWHTILSTRMTMYFSKLINSYRHENGQAVRVIKVNSNGEVQNQ